MLVPWKDMLLSLNNQGLSGDHLAKKALRTAKVQT